MWVLDFVSGPHCPTVPEVVQVRVVRMHPVGLPQMVGKIWSELHTTWPLVSKVMVLSHLLWAIVPKRDGMLMDQPLQCFQATREEGVSNVGP